MLSFIKNIPQAVIHFLKVTDKRYTIGGAVIIVVLTLVGWHFLTRPAPAETSVSNISSVTLASVASLSSQSGPLPVTGTVTSLHQATILAQNSGEITQVYKKLGDSVAAGEIIARFENSSQAAAVVQAQGAYDGAQAQLAKTKTGDTSNQKDISAIQNTQSQQALTNSQTSAINAIKSAYTTFDDAIHAKTDILFDNPTNDSPQFLLHTSNSQLTITLQNERPIVEQKLNELKILNDTLNDSSDIDGAISDVVSNAQYLSQYLSNLAENVGDTISSTETTQAMIDADLASVNTARSAVASSISDLNTAKSSYDSAVSSALVAGKQAADTTGGGRSEDIAIGEASVKQALGALNAAQANLEKTIIRSPISGTIVTLPIKSGDYVTTFSQAAIVSNPGALEIVTYVTSDDAKTITVGGKVTIGETLVSGVITRIAPSIDPTTNKIEVHIGITGNSNSLTDGENVVVNIDRGSGTKAGAPAAQGPLTIPIVSLKITPDGPVVFTLSASSTLVSQPVTIGSILGDRIVIISGLTPDMTIVSDARGHAVGESVRVTAQ